MRGTRIDKRSVKTGKIIFITGTDTGVGKTLLTVLLLRHLRQSGIRALATKPFCSGGLRDVNLLRAAQGNELTAEEINPFYFKKPLAPLAASPANRLPSLRDVITHVHAVAERCDVLLVEGSGGLMVPLGEEYFVTDLIQKLTCDKVLLATRNKLGTINHTLLSVRELQQKGVNGNLKIVFMQQKEMDLSSRTNARIVARFVGRKRVFSLPFLGENIEEKMDSKEFQKKIQKTLARLV